MPGGSRQEGRKHTCKRREWQKSMQGQTKVTLKQRLEERREHHSHNTRGGHMTNIYQTDSDEEAIVDFVKDHGELYNISEDFKDKARKGKGDGKSELDTG